MVHLNARRGEWDTAAPAKPVIQSDSPVALLNGAIQLFDSRTTVDTVPNQLEKVAQPPL